jgi:hypothetical protein
MKNKCPDSSEPSMPIENDHSGTDAAMPPRWLLIVHAQEPLRKPIEQILEADGFHCLATAAVPQAL